MSGGNCCSLSPNAGSRPQQRLQLGKKKKKKKKERKKKEKKRKLVSDDRHTVGGKKTLVNKDFDP